MPVDRCVFREVERLTLARACGEASTHVGYSCHAQIETVDVQLNDGSGWHDVLNTAAGTAHDKTSVFVHDKSSFTSPFIIFLSASTTRIARVPRIRSGTVYTATEMLGQ